MSRTRKQDRRFQLLSRFDRRGGQKTFRRLEHLLLTDEVKQLGDELREVLADWHEERGRLRLAQRLREGRNTTLPVKPGR